jgi:hypothetical protein
MFVMSFRGDPAERPLGPLGLLSSPPAPDVVTGLLYEVIDRELGVNVVDLGLDRVALGRRPERAGDPRLSGGQCARGRRCASPPTAGRRAERPCTSPNHVAEA